MSTVAEIEAALPTLSPAELRQVGDTVHRLQAQGDVSPELAQMERELGIVPFPKRGGPPVTTEFVRRLCEEEGI